MLIGAKISNLEDETKLQRHNLRRKDQKYFKEKIKKIEKNTTKKNDVNIKIQFIN